MTAIRVQRFLARAGVTSRRKAEALIAAGRVRIDGRLATLGQSVDPGTQRITLDDREIQPGRTIWLALHKPAGVAVTRSDPRGRPTVFSLVDDAPGLTYVGRLDLLTSGLLLLTTDGEAAHRLTHPRFEVPRTYVARLDTKLVTGLARQFERPTAIDDRPVRATEVRARAVGSAVELRLTLREGRNRIVRRLCSALGYRVLHLHRIAYGPIRLGRLQAGHSRPLGAGERATLERVWMSTAPSS